LPKLSGSDFSRATVQETDHMAASSSAREQIHIRLSLDPEARRVLERLAAIDRRLRLAREAKPLPPAGIRPTLRPTDLQCVGAASLAPTARMFSANSRARRRWPLLSFPYPSQSRISGKIAPAFLGLSGHLPTDGCSISSYWSRYVPSRGSKLARQCSQLALSRFSA
jgi:hypothetical protein